VTVIFKQIVCGLIRTTNSNFFAQKYRLLAELRQFKQRGPLSTNHRVVCTASGAVESFVIVLFIFDWQQPKSLRLDIFTEDIGMICQYDAAFSACCLESDITCNITNTVSNKCV